MLNIYLNIFRGNSLHKEPISYYIDEVHCGRYSMSKEINVAFQVEEKRYSYVVF